MADPDASELRSRLSGALRNAMRARDSHAVSALRSALSAIANAEAVAPPETGHALKPRIGIGVGDVARRQLSMSDLTRIVEGEIRDREHAATEYARLGRAEEAEALRGQAAILRRFLEGST